MSKDKNFAVYVMATLTIVFWGMSFASAKIATSEAPAMLVLFLRLGLALPLHFVLALKAGEARLPTRGQALVLLFMGFMGFYFHIGIQTLAMKFSGSATANWQMAATPAAAALLSAVFLHERLRLSGILGILIAFLGVVVVLGLGTKGGGISSYNFGDFLITVSMLNWASFMVITRRLFRDGGYTPLFTIFWEIFFAVLMCAATLLFMDIDIRSAANFSASGWCSICVLGFLCSGLAYTFWYRAAARIPVAQLMVFQFMQPLIGVITAYFLIGERFTPWLALGGAMIIAGVCIVNKQKQRPHTAE